MNTNVLISGILKQHGAEATVLNLVAAKTLTWCVSQPILDEYRVTLTRTKFDFTPAIVALWMDMAAVGHVVKPTSTITESKDERDNRFLDRTSFK